MKTIEDLKAIKLAEIENEKPTKLVVGMATCGIAAGATPIYDMLKACVKEAGLSDTIELKKTGCIGICQYEPIFEFYKNGERFTYVNMDAKKAKEVFEKHVLGGQPVSEYMMTLDGNPVNNLMETRFMRKQVRIALRNCGIIDPESINEYISRDGYAALNKVLSGMSREDVMNEILSSGLRGRGGAGFPTGLKWKFAMGSTGKKYVCCNADEGDPGAFMDRSVLEGDPHAVLEAMAIAGYVIGSDQGFIYVRAEYPIAIKRLKIAIEQAHKYGLLGENIFGTGFNFDISLRLGAGAFVCGEETALMTSI